jgi:class I fructose-bisphosphate aldolase
MSTVSSTKTYELLGAEAESLLSYESILHTGLAGTGYVSILPVDQGIEHSAGASFAPAPQYFDPEDIVKLAIEGGCNAVASTLDVAARWDAHKTPFMVKLNHNEFISYPNRCDQMMFPQVKQARDIGVVSVDYHLSADLTGQANHLGVTIEADTIKQKMSENNGCYNALENFRKTHKNVYSDLNPGEHLVRRWGVFHRPRRVYRLPATFVNTSNN